ncbi:MAG: hypothetical protein GWO02_13845, partial [Gammaproteobacteria bacterium]|nr:hypothetical protein [Gammaproteobacteria bacterium]
MLFAEAQIDRDRCLPARVSVRMKEQQGMARSPEVDDPPVFEMHGVPVASLPETGGGAAQIEPGQDVLVFQQLRSRPADQFGEATQDPFDLPLFLALQGAQSVVVVEDPGRLDEERLAAARLVVNK